MGASDESRDDGSRTMKRIPAFDGLRAVAIVMVVAYHADKSLVPAGHWGVIVFFVLSGYLVTRRLSAEKDRTGRIRLGPYYLKRWLRLTPALVVVCLVLLTVGTGLPKVAAALGYYANYARIEGLQLGRLTHTWFLAVLAHFYLLWPLVIAAAPTRHRRRIVVVITSAAVVWRISAIVVMTPAWVYNATDTNAAALLAGCWLAVARPEPRRWAGWSIPVLAILVLLPVFGDTGSLLLWGGFAALALGVAAIQYALTSPSWLEHGSIVWIGQISYGLYLWHYVLVRSDIPLGLALAMSVVAAVASRYLVETPIQKWLSHRAAGGADGGAA
jgi:peptidoglycan/LPS O-acetylase OafA/YrhL